ncbi:uncharacterized protein LOC111697461 [Eurytemora carolleeae]|uniref:uncharacterized protein LOC111697461 n=1 Tax=Eurytemora carolleeae TaxID=1294199 RepID=UPI000C775DA7|nr:uncharacterized protein LOC111697461 [Eurytemora carolleeae]|eukprot:XP_023323252.1 uncharacterized protein LOC111697461 [Eurytemora affinis]
MKSAPFRNDSEEKPADGESGESEPAEVSNLPIFQRSSNIPLNPVHAYFRTPSGPTKIHTHRQCCMCKRLIKGKNPTNLVYHVTSKHPHKKNLLINDINAWRKKYFKKGPIQSTNSPAAIGIRKFFTKVPSGGTVYKQNDPRQKSFNEALISWICQSVLPISLVNDPNFKKMISIANPHLTVLCRHTLTKRAISLDVKCRDKMKRLLNTSRKVAVTTDIWSQKGSSGLGRCCPRSSRVEEWERSDGLTFSFQCLS